MFTDIEGSTSLLRRVGEETYASILSAHHGIIGGALAAHGGERVDTAGDGFFAVFTSPRQCLGAVVEMQRAFGECSWPAGERIRVRMGVHAGEAAETEMGLVGLDIHRAARIGAVAYGGQIVLSESVFALTTGSLPEGVKLKDLGYHRLKDLIGPERLYQVCAPGLQSEFDRLRSLDNPGIPNNLPRLATEWFGPMASLHERVTELRVARLVTLTGPGGVGKTRLAIEVASLVAQEHPDGVWLVELGMLADPGAVDAAMAVALGVMVQEGWSPTRAILDWLEGRRALLVIDNCEHLLGAVADLVAEIVEGCPTVTVIATSREPLGVAGERVTVVRSLGVSDATELFFDRASAAGSASTVVEEDREVVAAICARLDGIPLAVELAAARTRSLTPADLLERLSDRFRVLRGSRSGGSDRHQTLQTTVAWSYRLLPPKEQLLFDRLSVFAGGFDLPAAEAVCGGEGIERTDVIELLAELVDKSLVMASRSAGSTRYLLLETLRQYGEERLDERDQTTATRGRHLVYYLTVAEDCHQRYATEDWLAAKVLAGREWNNFRIAHATAIDAGQVEPAERLVKGTSRHAYSEVLVEWLDWVERSIALSESVGRRDPAVFGQAGAVAFLAGDYETAVEYGRRGIAVADHPLIPETLLCWALMAMALVYLGQVAEALEATRQLERVPIEALDPVDAAWGPNILALIAMVLDPDRVEGHLVALRELAHRSASPWISMLHAYAAGLARLRTRPPDWAGTFNLCQQGLRLARSSGCAMHVANGLEYLTFACPGLSVAEADQTCADAIGYSYDRRIWAVLWTAMGYTVGHLVRRGSTELAATVAGYLDANQPGILPLCVFLPEGTLAELADRGYSDTRARGAQLHRTEVVPLVLSALSEPPELPVLDRPRITG